MTFSSVCNIPLYDILHTDENVIYRPVDQAQKLGLMVDITEGMAFLHLKGIIHKDIMSFIRACTTYLYPPLQTPGDLDQEHLY